MTTVALPSSPLQTAPKLRLLPKEGSAARRDDEGSRPHLRLISTPAPVERPVLLAGGDAQARKAVQSDLAKTMPSSTSFEHAGAIWEVLIRAPEASMVIVTGELDEMPAEALMQMLVQQSPELPVVCLDATQNAQSTYAAPAAQAAAR
ncbi:MAG: hypothetical protein ACYDHT_04950 [Solirubrobacteraceae bacterium]